MDDRVLGVAMNGVTGRMGYRQHLVRSVLAIRDDGGVVLPDGTRVIPEPVLVGRSERKLREIAERHGLERWTTNLDSALSDPTVHLYFDSQVTNVREDAVRRAVAAGKHIYAEKPVADTEVAALELARLVEDAGLKSGVVQDKLFLPGFRKLRRLVDSGFFGEILSIRGEFGYWVFEGDWQSAQRPSWNYRAEDGGGMALDMLPHWHYLLESVFAPVSAVTARLATHVPNRVDERGVPYAATADDAAYAIIELATGAIAQINSSWCVRVNREELVEFQVDGTLGSAVAGLRECRAQSRAATPRCVWDPDRAEVQPYREQWQTVPDNAEFPNGFRHQWELFLSHLQSDEPFPHDFRAGARGLRLAEAAQRSSAEGRRVEIPTEDR